MKKLNFLLCVLLFIPFCLLAQQVQIRGKVIEAETNEPLPG